MTIIEYLFYAIDSLFWDISLEFIANLWLCGCIIAGRQYLNSFRITTSPYIMEPARVRTFLRRARADKNTFMSLKTTKSWKMKFKGKTSKLIRMKLINRLISLFKNMCRHA